MPRLHHTKLTPTIFTATTAAVGYPAANLGNEQILRPYRATDLLATDIVIQLQAVATIYSLFVHDVNFAEATIEKSVDGVVWVPVGTLTTYPDRHGRRRGSIVIDAAGQLAIRIRIAAGVATDGLAYWRGGCAYLFGAGVTLAAAPDYGYRVRTKRPRASAGLLSGLVATAVTGPNRDRIELNFPRRDTELIDDLVQKASAGTCALDMQLPSYPEQQWPVRYVDEDLEETFAKKNLSAVAIPLLEVV